MLEHILLDVAYVCGSVAADNISTAAFVRKQRTLDHELNLGVREGMRSTGVGKFLTKDAIYKSLGLLGTGALLYGVDSALGIQDNNLNLHHGILYTISSMKYLAAASNTFGAFGINRVAVATIIPLLPFLYLTNLLHRKKVYDLPEVKIEWRL